MVLLYLNPKIKIDQFDGKGRGFISIDTIEKGEVLLVEKPDIFLEKYKQSPLYEILYQILDYNQLEKFNDLVPHQINTIETKFINELNMISNKKIKNKLSKFDDYTLSLLIRKYLQNAFNMDNTKKTIKPCILNYGVIFNHSCKPNVEFKFDNKNLQMIFFSNKKIGKKSELFDNYIDINLEFNKRQEILLHQYNFVCKCDKCIDDSLIFYNNTSSNRKK